MNFHTRYKSTQELTDLLAQLEAFIDRPAKTVNETRRLIDHLQSRDQQREDKQHADGVTMRLEPTQVFARVLTPPGFALALSRNDSVEHA